MSSLLPSKQELLAGLVIGSSRKNTKNVKNVPTGSRTSTSTPRTDPGADDHDYGGNYGNNNTRAGMPASAGPQYASKPYWSAHAITIEEMMAELTPQGVGGQGCQLTARKNTTTSAALAHHLGPGAVPVDPGQLAEWDKLASFLRAAKDGSGSLHASVALTDTIVTVPEEVDADVDAEADVDVDVDVDVDTDADADTNQVQQ